MEEYTGEKDLIAYHNISQDNLDKAIQLSGLAVPSIAITKKETDFSNFGDITLLMPQDVVNSKETPVYTRGAWTYRYGQGSKEKEADRLYKQDHSASAERNPTFCYGLRRPVYSFISSKCRIISVNIELH